MNTVIETNKKPRRNIVMQLLAFLLLLVGSHSAMAVCSGGGGSSTVTLPTTTVVPRDIAVGQPLSAWVYMPSTVNYSCSYTSSSSYYVRGIGASMPGMGSAGSSYYDSSTGTSYSLLSTGVAGVGMAVMFYATDSAYNCSGSFYMDVTGHRVNAMPYGWTGAGCVTSLTSQTGYFTGRMAVRLVRIPGTVVSGGVTNAGSLNQICAFAGGPSSSSNITTMYQDSAPCTSISLTATTIQVAACTTPDVLVPLGTHSPSEMASVGSTTQAVAFNVKLNNCPAGMNQIQYRIEPATTVVSSTLSTVALDSSSSASGVAVQLLNAAGTAAAPLSTTTFQTFSGYNASTGGSYTIPFQARYYRTGNITPGTANTSMTFTMQYL